MAHQTARMLVEAGIIPRNVIQQLARYRLVPEDYEKLHGSRPLDSSDGDRVAKFVKGLSEAITEDTAEMRETELYHYAGYKQLMIHFEDERLDGRASVLVDRFGRLIVPNEMPWTSVTKVRYPDESFTRPVVRKELRYEGYEATSMVLCVESPDDIKAEN